MTLTNNHKSDIIGEGKTMTFPFIMDEHPYSDYQFNMSMNEHTGMINLTKTPVTMSEDTNKNGFWKYNEDEKIGRAHV